MFGDARVPSGPTNGRGPPPVGGPSGKEDRRTEAVTTLDVSVTPVGVSVVKFLRSPKVFSLRHPQRTGSVERRRPSPAEGVAPAVPMTGQVVRVASTPCPSVP